MFSFFQRYFIYSLAVILIGGAAISDSVTAASLAADNHQVAHVIHVSVDGLNAIYLESLLQGDADGSYATYQRLVSDGAYTFNARTDADITVTLPNHVSMLTGRPLNQPEGVSANHHHGYSYNVTPETWMTLHNSGNGATGYIASVFDVAHDYGLSTGLYVSKDRFVIFDQSYNETTGRADSIGEDNGRDKIDYYINLESSLGSQDLHTAALQSLKDNHPNYAFIHYSDPDKIGHDIGWGSTDWNSAVAATDNYLADLVWLIENDPIYKNNTVLIVTSDHGGEARGHGDQSSRNSYTVPVFIFGAGIAQGTDLYELNATQRQNPGEDAPSHSVNEVQPIRNGETGNLALDLLGLPAIPWSFMNNTMNVAGSAPAPAPTQMQESMYFPLVLH